MVNVSRRQAIIAATALVAPAPAAEPPTSPPPKFGLGLVTYNLAAKWDLPTVLRVCKEARIAAVEFRTTHAHGVEPTLTADQRRSVKARCIDSGVKVWGCGTACEFQAVDHAVLAANIETCKRFTQLVADIGGQGVKVRPNGLPKGVATEKTLDQIGKALVTCGKAATDAGVEIWVEVHGAGTQLPPNMKTIMERCGHPAVGICWNSNATDVVNKSVAASFNMLQPWLKSCHINELYKEHTGAYPYRELFRLLKNAGYNRYTLIEVGRTPADAESGLEIAKYYRSLWEELVT